MTQDGLHRVQAYRTDALYVLPGADLGEYGEYIIAPVEIFYREPAAGQRANEFRPAERARFEEHVTRELHEALEAGGAFEAAEAAGPGVLRVRAQFVDLALGVPRRASPAQVNVWTTTEFRLFLDVSDSQTGVSLLRLADAQILHPASLGAPLATGGVAHPSATNTTAMEESAALRQAIGNRARVLRETLDRLRNAGPLPERVSSGAGRIRG